MLQHLAFVQGGFVMVDTEQCAGTSVTRQHAKIAQVSSET